MAFSVPVKSGDTIYRWHEATIIKHLLGRSTEVRVRSWDREGGEVSRESVHVHELDDSMGFEAAEAWLQTLEAFEPYTDERDAIIEAVAGGLDDGQAATVPWAYPQWAADGSYTAGDRVRHDRELYRCLQEHDAQEGWSPDAAPSLWARVLSGQSEAVPDWVQPDSTNPYMSGDHVMHNGAEYVSTVDNNVWEPGVYGWEEV